MPNTANTEERVRPTLRLRSEALNGSNEPQISYRPLDGPWMPDPSCLGEARSMPHSSHAVGVGMKEYRASFKEQHAQTLNKLKKLKAAKRLDELKIRFCITMWPSVDMLRMDGRTDDEIESALENYYVGAQ